MNEVNSATTTFYDGRALHFAAIRAGELGTGTLEHSYIYLQERPGQHRRSMRSWEYRTIHDGLAAYNAKVKRLARGEAIT